MLYICVEENILSGIFDMYCEGVCIINIGGR